MTVDDGSMRLRPEPGRGPALEREDELDRLVRSRPTGQDFDLWIPPQVAARYDGVEPQALTARYLKSVLRRAAIFVDIGAGWGFFTRLAASAAPTLKIVAIEPDAGKRAVLTANAADLIAAGRVEIRAEAISDSVSAEPLESAAAADASDFSAHLPAPSNVRTDQPTTTIDRLLADAAIGPLVMKIDAEGDEIAVLDGMAETLERFDEVCLVVAFAPNRPEGAGALLSHLHRAGFVPFLVDDDAQQFHRLGPDADVVGSDARGRVQIIGLRKQTALGAVLFSHSAKLHGAERSLLSLVDDFVGQRWAPCTVVLPSDGPLAERLRQAGASVWIAPYVWWCGLAGSPPEELSAAATASMPTVLTEVVPRIRAIGPDIVITQTMVIPWGAVAATMLGIPHIWSVCEYGQLDHGLQFIAPFDQIKADIAAGADFIYCCSHSVRMALFPDLLPDRCDRIYRHIELAAPGDATIEHGNANGVLRLGLFGSMAASKGQTDAIAAVAELRARGVPVELLLVGNGPAGQIALLTDMIQSLGLETCVRMPGFIDDPYPTMRDCDVVLVCSRHEAFGRTAVEAMLLGRPVVYSASGGTAEFMRDGETGLAYQPGSVGDLADQIKRLARDVELRARLGAAGQAYARATFTRDNYGAVVFAKAVALRDERHQASAMPTALAPALAQATVAALSRAQEAEQAQAATSVRQADAERSAGERIGGLEAVVNSVAGRAAEAERWAAVRIADLERDNHRLADLVTATRAMADANIAALERRIADLQQRLVTVTADNEMLRRQTWLRATLHAPRDLVRRLRQPWRRT